ncbi:MAG: hypothetical protein Q4B71_00280 [Cardiobacteriaceae bacterium]|nr:hypothetical protein [Cardiobacteriaceae bacterium]
MYNIFQQLQSLNPNHALYHAVVIGIKADGTIIAQTSSGTTLLLAGQAKIGDHVFYNSQNHQIVKSSPALNFTHLTI